MAMRPFVIKHAFYLPGQHGLGKGTQGAVAHLDYMGDPARHSKSDEALLMGDPSIHAKYMTERPGVSGYFGPDPRTLPDVARIQATLASHTGPIWRDFVSVSEADALTLGGGLVTREGWEKAARRALPPMFEKMGLNPAGVAWVASVHKKEGHPHMHLLYWEKQPHRVKGQWSDKERQAIRRGWVQELYGPERIRLGQEKSALRQHILAAVKLDDIGFVPPRLQKTWARCLTALADHLPGQGRQALQFMPPAVKAEACAAAEWLFHNVPAFEKSARRYGDIAAEMAAHYRDDDRAQQTARENALNDLTERVAQLVLRAAANQESAVGWDAVQDALNAREPSARSRLWRISRLTGGARRQAIHTYAERLRTDNGQGEQAQKPLEHRIEQVARYIEEAHRRHAAHSLRFVFMGMRRALWQADSENRRAAARERWAATQREWEDERLRHGQSLDV